MPDTNTNASLTIKGNALVGHKFKAVRIGKYSMATIDDGKIRKISVTTDPAPGLVDAGKHALQDIGVPEDSSSYPGNPIGQVAANWSGAQGGNNSSGITSSQIRKFVLSLVQDPQFANAQAAVDEHSVNANSPDPKSLTISGLKQGLYVIVDTTPTGQGGRVSASVPMLVGTAVAPTANDPGYTEYADGGADIAPLGVITFKANVPLIEKKFVNMQNRSVAVGTKVNYQVTASVPLTSGFPDGGYVYKVTDVPSKGLSINPASVKVYTSPTESGSIAAATEITSHSELWNARAENSPETGNPVLVIRFPGIMNTSYFKYGQFIFITYSNTVNEQSQSGVLSNGVMLNYSNDFSNPSTPLDPMDPSKGPNEGTGSQGVTDPSGGSDGENPDTNLYFYGLSIVNRSKVDGRSRLMNGKFTVSQEGSDSPMKFKQRGKGNYIRAADQNCSVPEQCVTELVVSDGKAMQAHGARFLQGYGHVSTADFRSRTQVFNAEAADDLTDSGKINAQAGYLFVNGLAVGTYKITQVDAPTEPKDFPDRFLPSYKETISNDAPATADAPLFTVKDDVWDLVGTPKPNNSEGIVSPVSTDPVSLKLFSPLTTVYNVDSPTQLSMTGVAGLILAVLVALVCIVLALILYRTSRRGRSLPSGMTVL
ncbi:isopeptide-forming domain-containing fimbrial protein [Bifidobacterium aemilianum]|nr:isopeptide-forming domain-containing fimbrial protein [Bifidobacterium aemilianum]